MSVCLSGLLCAQLSDDHIRINDSISRDSLQSGPGWFRTSLTLVLFLFHACRILLQHVLHLFTSSFVGSDLSTYRHAAQFPVVGPWCTLKVAGPPGSAKVGNVSARSNRANKRTDGRTDNRTSPIPVCPPPTVSSQKWYAHSLVTAHAILRSTSNTAKGTKVIAQIAKIVLLS